MLSKETKDDAAPKAKKKKKIRTGSSQFINALQFHCTSAKGKN